MRTFFFGSLLSLLLAAAVTGGGRTGDGTAAATPAPADTADSYTETVPGTIVEFDMVRVPGGSVMVNGTEKTVEPFWIAKTETRWDAYDAYRLDEKMKGIDPATADAISLPSKPYGFGNEIPGFGQEKYPALSVTRNAARQYARWLSAKTDRSYRLPTAAEWKHACQLGYGTPADWGPDRLGTYAWFQGNAGGAAHPTASLKPSDLGVYDQLGNAAELVAPPEGSPDQPTRVWGGSYRSAADDVHCSARREKTPAWQESDPQLPKSKWWLSDAHFVGFRVVRSVGSS